MPAHMFAYVAMPWESVAQEMKFKREKTHTTTNRRTPLIFFNIFRCRRRRCPPYQDAHMHLRMRLFERTCYIVFTCTPEITFVRRVCVQEFPNNMRSNEPIWFVFQSPFPPFIIFLSNHTQFALIS